MRIAVVISCFVITFIFSFCNPVGNHNQSSLVKTDSLEKLILQKDSIIDSLSKQVVKINVQNVKSPSGDIILFKPVGLEISITKTRPQLSNDNFLIVPAAYTTLSTGIDGLYYINGVEMNSIANSALKGTCLISGSGISIIDFDSIRYDIKAKIKQDKSSMFQQTLLIRNSEVVPDAIFGNKKNIRRALIQLKDGYCVCQSDKPITISDFRQSLTQIGVLNAVNLDMGTWSEGWYINQFNEKIKIGEFFTNTSKQTNWLLYPRK